MTTSPTFPKNNIAPDWNKAPEGFNWLAQDADGKWYWYKTEPVLGVGGGIWRSNSRNQQFAAEGQANLDWFESMQTRPDNIKS